MLYDWVLHYAFCHHRQNSPITPSICISDNFKGIVIIAMFLFCVPCTHSLLPTYLSFLFDIFHTPSVFPSQPKVPVIHFSKKIQVTYTLKVQWKTKLMLWNLVEIDLLYMLLGQTFGAPCPVKWTVHHCYEHSILHKTCRTKILSPSAYIFTRLQDTTFVFHCTLCNNTPDRLTWNKYFYCL